MLIPAGPVDGTLPAPPSPGAPEMLAGSVRLDLDRRRRLGMVEAIWGEHKSAEQIALVLEQLQAASELGLATRVDPAKAEAVAALLAQGPQAGGRAGRRQQRPGRGGRSPAGPALPWHRL